MDDTPELGDQFPVIDGKTMGFIEEKESKLNYSWDVCSIWIKSLFWGYDKKKPKKTDKVREYRNVKSASQSAQEILDKRRKNAHYKRGSKKY